MFHGESGYRTYIITAGRMISGDVLKYRKWVRVVIPFRIVLAVLGN
jgi:hypothetical protein